MLSEDTDGDEANSLLSGASSSNVPEKDDLSYSAAEIFGGTAVAAAIVAGATYLCGLWPDWLSSPLEATKRAFGGEQPERYQSTMSSSTSQFRQGVSAPEQGSYVPPPAHYDHRFPIRSRVEIHNMQNMNSQFLNGVCGEVVSYISDHVNCTQRLI